MKKPIVLLVILAAAWATPCLASLDLSWNDCALESFTQNVNFTNCATQANRNLNLYSTFRTPVMLPNFVSATLTYDLQQEGVSNLDSFWRFDAAGSGGCNESGLVLHVSGDSLGRCGGEPSPWGASGSEAIGTWSFTAGTGGANRGRLVVTITRPSNSPYPLVADQDYYMCNLVIRNLNRLTCSGCGSKVSIVWTSARLVSSDNSVIVVRGPGPVGDCVSVNGAGPDNCPYPRITATAGGGGTIDPLGVTPVSGPGTRTFTMIPDAGQQISDVRVDGVSVGPVASYTFTEVIDDHTIHADFAPTTYTINASAGPNGTIIPSGVVVVPTGSNRMFAMNPNPGWLVSTVVVDGVPQGALSSYTFTNIQTSHTIEVGFVVHGFEITASAGPGGSISPSGVFLIAPGSSQVYTITPAPNFLIADVLVDGVSVGAVASYTFMDVLATHTIAASFTINGNWITASADVGGTIAPSGMIAVGFGASQSFVIASSTHYIIGDVQVDGVSVGAVTSYTFTNVQAPHTIAASFVTTGYAITASSTPGGTIAPSGDVWVLTGASQSFTIAPAANRSLAEVLVDGVSVGVVTSYTFTNVVAAHTIVANFATTVTASAGAGGSISPTGIVSLIVGHSKSFTITPDPGHVVADVRVDSVSMGAVTTYTFASVDAPRTITASFVWARNSWTPDGLGLAPSSASVIIAMSNAVLDGAGGAIVAWSDRRNGSNTDIYAGRGGAGGVRAWDLGGVAVSTASGNQSAPVLGSDGAGGVIVVWTDGRFDDTNTDIYARRVDVNGVVHWATGGVPVCEAAGIQGNPVVTTDGQGGAIIAWEDTRSGSSNPDIYAQRVSADGVMQWTEGGVALCLLPSGQSKPVITTDGSGGVIVAWQDERAGVDVYAQRVSAGGVPLWTANGVAVGATSDADMAPANVADGSGGAIVAWSRGNLDLRAQRVDASGVIQWPASGAVFGTFAGAAPMWSLASDGTGGAISVWGDNAGILSQRLNDAGVSQWGSGSRLRDYPPYGFLAASADGSGGAILATQFPPNPVDGTLVNLIQRVNSSGSPQWGPYGIAVEDMVTSADPFRFAVDGSGNTIFATTGHSRYCPSPYHPPCYVVPEIGVLAMQRRLASGAEDYTVAVALASVTAYPQLTPRIVADGVGGSIVAWSDSRNFRADIYAQRLSASGAQLWTNTGLSMSLAGQDKSAPQITTDGFGGAIVAWTQGGSDIYAQWSGAGGGRNWGDVGVVVGSSTGAVDGMQLVSDGAGGAIAAWQDNRNGGSDVYAQRIGATGVVQWLVNGVLLNSGWNPQMIADGAGGTIIVCETFTGSLRVTRLRPNGTVRWTIGNLSSASASPSDPRIVSDGAGGAIIAWVDRRNGGADLYAQRVSAAGTVQWGASDVALCKAPGDQVPPEMVADGNLGAILAWTDTRSGADIYAQRVTGDGVRQWGASGIAVCVASGLQQSPSIDADGSGGAVVAWEDFRNGNLDVYAQQLSSCGASLWLTNGVAVCTASGDQGSPHIVTSEPGAVITTWQDERGTAATYLQRTISAPGGLETIATTAVGHGSICPPATVSVETGDTRTFAVTPDSGYKCVYVFVDGVSVGPVASYTFTNVAANHTLQALFRSLTVDAEMEPQAALSFAIAGPSPSVGGARFRLELPAREHVRLSIYDLAGRRVAELLDGELAAGEHAVVWSANGSGHSRSAGIFFAKMKAGSREFVRRIVVLE